MTYLIVYQISGGGIKPTFGNCEYTFNGKPLMDDIRNLEDWLCMNYAKVVYPDIPNLEIVVTGLFPLGW